MTFTFEETCKSYAIPIDEERFLDLLDSESYVTGNAAYADTLLRKLEKLPGVSDIDYDGHFGAAVYLTISTDEDSDALKSQISEIIESHLQWCAKLTKAQHVIERRKP